MYKKCNIKPPRERGPTLKKYLGSANARGYICNNSGAVFRQSLLVVSNCSHLLKLRIRAHLANMIKLRRRPHVEIRLRKKVSALWNSRNSWVMRDLSDWLTDWPLTSDHCLISPDRIVPPHFRILPLVRFWKMRHFWKAYNMDSAASQKFETPPH